MWKCRLCWASGDETLDLTGRWIIEWFLFWIKRYIQLFIWTQNHTTHTEVECRLCRCGVDAGAGGIMVLTLVTSCKHILNIVWPPTSRPVIASYLTGVAAASAPAHLAPHCSTTLLLYSSPDHNLSLFFPLGAQPFALTAMDSEATDWNGKSTPSFPSPSLALAP